MVGDFEEFVLMCERDEIRLTHLQLTFAREVLASYPTRRFYMGGMGSGRTFVAERLERFFDEKRRT